MPWAGGGNRPPAPQTALKTFGSRKDGGVGFARHLAATRIITCQLQNLTIEIVSLLLDGLTCLEQRPNHSHQLGAILNQFLGLHGKDIELATAAGEGPA
jgi:hypothetical protein